MAKTLRTAADEAREEAAAASYKIASLAAPQPPAPVPAPVAPTPQKANKPKKETKVRINIMVLPSQYEDIKKIAFVNRKSSSKVIGEALELYISAMGKVIKEYDSVNIWSAAGAPDLDDLKNTLLNP